MNNNFYTQADFMNLTADDISKIKKIMSWRINNDDDEYFYLYQNINNISKNEKANQLLFNKLLAGQTTIKWFKFKYTDEFTKNFLENKLNSFNSNVDLKENYNDVITDTVTNTIQSNNLYYIKIFINDGFTRVSDGVNSRRQCKIRSVVTVIDINNCWVEVRCVDKKIDKIVKILEKDLGFKDLKNYPILKNYNSDIEKFLNDLNKGVYKNYKAMPLNKIELTDNDTKAAVQIINSVDNYLKDKDIQKLIDDLEKLEYDLEDLSIIQILLSGIDALGMSVKMNNNQSMSNDAFYTVLKKHIFENNSHIVFTSEKNEHEDYTIHVGHKNNTIRFVSSVTEDIISYIRNKIL